jgi:DNA polymerase-3 subunit beta
MTATKEKKRSVKLTSVTRHGGTELTLSAGVLRAALTVVGKAINTRAINPLLANVLIEMGTMTASDGEMRITTPLDCANGPAMLVPHDRLSRIVSSVAPDAEVVITTSGTQCEILCGHGRWLLPTSDPKEYPQHKPEEFRPIAHLPGDQFSRLMRSVKCATDADSSRYALAGVLLEFKGGILSMIATDGRRMHASEAEIDQAVDDSTTIVPRRVIDVILAIIGSGMGSLQLEANKTEIMAEIGGTILTARLLEGRFPKWRDIVPAEQPATTVGVAQLLEAVRQGSICRSETTKGSQFVISETVLAVSSESSEYGSSRASCEVIGTGKVALKLDASYVIEFLSTLDSADNVTIEAAGNDAATVFRCGETFAVIMPMA